MNDNKNAIENEKSQAAAAAGREVKKKSVMLFVSLALLITAAVFLTFAWYTKMTSVSNAQFDLAQWDFRAEFQSGEVIANVYQSAQVSNNKVAPGTEGEIPLRLLATQSNTDVDFYIIVDNVTETSPEFQQRLIFYYRNGDTSEDFQKTGTDITADTLFKFDYGQSQILAGKITKGEYKDVTIYWRWVYDFQEAVVKGSARKPDNMTAAQWNTLVADAKNKGNIEFYDKYPELCAAWDEFDTQVGKYPEAFEDDMNVKFRIIGAEPKPSPSPSLNA